MKSKIKILLCINLVVLILFSFMCPVFAYSEADMLNEEYATFGEEDTYEPSGDREYRGGYYIESYNVDINITKENVYEIEETIVAYFNPTENKHGIIRNIPLDSKVTREDGSSDYKYARIKNVKITDEYGNFFDYESDISDVASYKIGDAHRTVAGEVTYKISYDYHLSGDNISDADEIYFNIIGTEWDTNIYNVTFNITTPDPIDTNTLGFSVGEYGAIGHDTEKLKYKSNGNTLSGEYCGALSSNEGITIRCFFPEGYFEIPFNIREYIYVFTLIIPLILTGASIFIYIRIKKKNKPIEVIEFYPPDDLHSLDIAHIYKGPIGRKEIFSLMLYCASKGYVEITEDLYTGEFSFKYIKRYDGHNAVVDKFLFTLFKRINNTLSMDDIAKDFDDIVITLSKNYAKNDKYIVHKTKEKRLLSVLNLLIFIFGVFMSIFAARELTREIDIIIGFVLSIVVAVMRFSIVERTPEGKSLYGRVLGFKRFLETAEKSKLEALVEETPTYFYDILPYTYVLGVSDKWVKKFDDITINEMDTYKINRHTFGSSFNSLNDSFDKAYERAHPSSSSGGSGSSGGGSSGGGSGGGGGSSW